MLKIFFSPFSLLYTFITSCRNLFYKKQILKSHQFEIYTINVGNLIVGGTGKTPMIEYLISLLSDTYRTVVLSRGYGRKTKGYILANDKANAKTIGDEPFQYYLKFKDKIKVAVSEDRVRGVWRLDDKYKNLEIVLLDDAFQHRAIVPHLNLLLTDYHRLFYKDYVLPSGKLRESRSGAKRADAVIVTKCPTGLEGKEKFELTKEIQKYTSENTPIFFAKIKYSKLVGFNNQTFMPQLQLYLISAIAYPSVYESYLREKFDVLDHLIFADHHSFSRQDIDNVLAKVGNKPFTVFITTEKDMVKIKPLLTDIEKNRFFYLPIEVGFDNKKAFDEFILNNVMAYYTT